MLVGSITVNRLTIHPPIWQYPYVSNLTHPHLPLNILAFYLFCYLITLIMRISTWVFFASKTEYGNFFQLSPLKAFYPCIYSPSSRAGCVVRLAAGCRVVCTGAITVSPVSPGSTATSQSEARVQVTWPVLTNQRPVLLPARDGGGDDI